LLLLRNQLFLTVVPYTTTPFTRDSLISKMSRMNRTLLILFAGLAVLANYVSAQETSESDYLDFPKIDNDESNRFFIVTTNATEVGIGLNRFLLSVGGILALLAILALVLFYYEGASANDSYGYSGYSDYNSGYARKSSYDPYAIDWDKFSIVDWLSIGEEAYRKFDPSDLNCQKRLICEIHQNTSKFGAAASKMVDFFSYLHYAEVLRLPEQFRTLVQEYMDAAERGRTMKKECGEVYDMCDFSVKNMVDKYNHNEI